LIRNPVEAVRLILVAASLLFACLLAGVYGALHNQISYTVAPEYFHAFKFRQFDIEPSLHNRIGAALVGWRASWWMGLFIGAPIALAGLFVAGDRAYARAFIASTLAVVGVTLSLGLAALAMAYATVSDARTPDWLDTRLADPVAFARAGEMHNGSYTAAGLGLLAGLFLMIRAARRSRRPQPLTAPR
jgi:hypothetical protein